MTNTQWHRTLACISLVLFYSVVQTCALIQEEASVVKGAAPSGGEAAVGHVMFVSWLGRSHIIPYLEILKELKAQGFRVRAPNAAATLQQQQLLAYFSGSSLLAVDLKLLALLCTIGACRLHSPQRSRARSGH